MIVFQDQCCKSLASNHFKMYISTIYNVLIISENTSQKHHIKVPWMDYETLIRIPWSACPLEVYIAKCISLMMFGSIYVLWLICTLLKMTPYITGEVANLIGCLIRQLRHRTGGLAQCHTLYRTLTGLSTYPDNNESNIKHSLEWPSPIVLSLWYAILWNIALVIKHGIDMCALLVMIKYQQNMASHV